MLRCGLDSEMPNEEKPNLHMESDGFRCAQSAAHACVILKYEYFNRKRRISWKKETKTQEHLINN